MDRRSFLTKLGIVIAAPAIVRVTSLMPIRTPSILLPKPIKSSILIDDVDINNSVSSSMKGGFIEIYSGRQPETPEALHTGKLLVRVALDTIDGSSGFGRIINSGKATNYRAITKDNIPIIDGSVDRYGANINMNSTNLVADAGLSIIDFKIKF